jgi:hypothetical protein
MEQFRTECGDGFGWRQPPYEYEAEKMPIDILWGSDRLRRAIDARQPAPEFVASCASEAERFLPTRARYLLY